MFTTFRIMRDCIRILFEALSYEVFIELLQHDIRMIPTVKELYDVYVWALSAGKFALSAHVQC